MTAEISIRGGIVVDGTGSPPAQADVGITDGKVVEIGDSVRGERQIDASGRLVVPGFIDIHTHYDPQVLWDPWLTPSSWHGVTTVVAGNCGYSIAPTQKQSRGSILRTLDKVEDMRLSTLEAGVGWDFETYPEYLQTVARRGTAINFGGYVGHTPVRLYVMGDEAYEREATADEIARMRQVVKESLVGGALGFSSDRGGFHLGDGGRPVPSIVSTQDELEALMGVTAEIGQGMVHVAPGERYSWVYDFQRRLGRTITWSSILTYPEGTASRAPYRDKLLRHDEGRRAGADVWVQVTCRPITQSVWIMEPTSLYVLPGFADLVATPYEDRPRVYADRAWRAKVWAQLDGGTFVNPRWGTFLVSESPSHPELIGRSVAAIAAERGCTPFDVVCDVGLDDRLETRFTVTFANDEEDGVALLIQSEGCIMGLSDAGAHVGSICDAVMPTDFLANWVRDRQVVPLETGIRKLTGELGDVLGIDRGYLRPGSPADVVVLDLDGLAPGPIHRVKDMPAGGDRLVGDEPRGVEWVLVNGTPIRAEEKPLTDQLGRLPGTIVRSRPGRR
jgi:N-acyl-D-aspartate/D-glutamate deacylase